MSNKDIFHKFLETYSSFIICTHANPDPDALGSVMALYKHLLRNNQQVRVILDVKIPDNIVFITEGAIVYNEESITPEILENQGLIVLDCSNEKRVGLADDHPIWQKPILNIDHHPDNSHFGTANLVVDSASSTGEIIFDLINSSPDSIDKDIAEALYIAIVGDTGGFRYSNTTAKVHQVIAKLLEHPINSSFLYERVLHQKSQKAFSLVRDAIKTVQICDGVASMVVSYELLQQHKITERELPELTDYIRSINGVFISVLYTEPEENFIKVSLRSLPPIDVSTVAHQFDGGGHRHAAGCRISGELNAVVENVNARLAILHKEYPEIL